MDLKVIVCLEKVGLGPEKVAARARRILLRMSRKKVPPNRKPIAELEKQLLGKKKSPSIAQKKSVYVRYLKLNEVAVNQNCSHLSRRP